MRDIDIRQELHRNHLSYFKYDNDTRIIDELGVCQGSIKIDIAVVNGSLIGYEIKSEQDTLYRLPAQMDAYNKVFDYIHIVVNEKHLEKVKEKIPAFWGIICVRKYDGSFKLDKERPAIKNVSSESFYLAQLLWKEEALDILKREQLDKGMKSKSRNEIWTKLSTNLPKEKVNEYVREYIKKRSIWRAIV